MPKTKKRFFTHTKTEEIAEKEKLVIDALQKGAVHFRKIQKVAKKEAGKKRPHFPSISRSIPEISQITVSGFPKVKLSWIGLVLAIFVGIIFNYFVGKALFASYAVWQKQAHEREKLSEQMALWENVAKQYPNYRDAYIEGAIFAYKLGDREKEKYFLDKLTIQDPNFPITKSFGELIKLQNIQ